MQEKRQRKTAREPRQAGAVSPGVTLESLLHSADGEMIAADEIGVPGK